MRKTKQHSQNNLTPALPGPDLLTFFEAGKMKKQVFNKKVIKRINQLPEVDKLPGIVVKHQLDLTTKIFIEQYSVFYDVLKWKIRDDNLILHFATSVWKELKRSIYNLYLSDNKQFELLISHQVNYVNFLYETLEDLFYQNAQLVNPFIKIFQITDKEKSKLRHRLDSYSKGYTQPTRRAYIRIIKSIVIDNKTDTDALKDYNAKQEIDDKKRIPLKIGKSTFNNFKNNSKNRVYDKIVNGIKNNLTDENLLKLFKN